jgi:hypothetical protein
LDTDSQVESRPVITGDEFGVICPWLGQCRLVHKLDQQQAPASSRDTYQVPDLLAGFNAAGPFLIEPSPITHWRGSRYSLGSWVRTRSTP